MSTHFLFSADKLSFRSEFATSFISLFLSLPSLPMFCGLKKYFPPVHLFTGHTAALSPLSRVTSTKSSHCSH
ncbi:hypothetical protein J6590_108099, partial [Homalodisca vitripennis]